MFDVVVAEAADEILKGEQLAECVGVRMDILFVEIDEQGREIIVEVDERRVDTADVIRRMLPSERLRPERSEPVEFIPVPANVSAELFEMSGDRWD